ncbi:MAG: toprim domain-containing protein, partial [Synergistaceae bacterium]|nr:toprim domain-containing protein [Synergistaceae bacterium]
MAYEAVPENLIIEQFAEFLYSAEFGALAPAENINLVLDKKTRYKTQGDKGSKTSGIYMIHSDGCPAGYAINYKISGEAFNWRFDFEKLKGDKKYNKFYDISQTPEFKAEAERVKREHEAREAKEKAEALDKAKKEFVNAPKLINPELEYLKRKKVKIFGELKSDAKGNIILPLKNIKGEFMSLQRIAPDGGKLFATDAVTAGAFFNIDLDKAKNNLDKPILICEGYATGATLYELTGCPVVCAMNCYNLARVSEAIRKKFKSHKIIIMADNDAKTKSERGFNPGIDHAQEANKKFKLDGVFYPEFSVFSAAAGKSDWNDYYCEFGEQKARAILDKSIKYACMTPQEKERRDRIIKIENQSPIINAADLLKKEFPPIKWAVPGIIPTGLTMLSGNPK